MGLCARRYAADDERIRSTGLSAGNSEDPRTGSDRYSGALQRGFAELLRICFRGFRELPETGFHTKRTDFQTEEVCPVPDLRYPGRGRNDMV